MSLVEKLEGHTEAIQSLVVSLQSKEGDIKVLQDKIEAGKDQPGELNAHYHELLCLIKAVESMKHDKELLESARNAMYLELKATRKSDYAGHFNSSFVPPPLTSGSKCIDRYEQTSLPTQNTMKPKRKAISKRGSTSHVQAKRPHRWHPKSIIASSPPTVVTDPEGQGYIELRCGVCGTNSSSHRGFLLGGLGFQLHFAGAHRGHMAKGVRLTTQAAIKLCTYKRLTDREVHDILAGRKDAYVVEQLMPSSHDSTLSTDDDLDENTGCTSFTEESDQAAVSEQEDDEEAPLSIVSADDDEERKPPLIEMVPHVTHEK